TFKRWIQIENLALYLTDISADSNKDKLREKPVCHTINTGQAKSTKQRACHAAPDEHEFLQKKISTILEQG
ncbi:14934_t:CDS:2, partial [Gigaspora margarita]